MFGLGCGWEKAQAFLSRRKRPDHWMEPVNRKIACFGFIRLLRVAKASSGDKGPTGCGIPQGRILSRSLFCGGNKEWRQEASLSLGGHE